MSFLKRIFSSNWIGSREEMAQFLERYFGWAPSGTHNGWDDFENLRLRDPDLDRERLAILDELGPINGPLSPDRRAAAEAQTQRIIARLRDVPESQNGL